MWSIMATYNFTREADVYIVYPTGGMQYKIDVSEIKFSQTFRNDSHPVKTLHAPYDFHEKSVFKRAGEASFDFTIATIAENDFNIVFDSLLKYKTGTYTLNSFDLYIQTNTHTFKIEKCVMKTGSFVIERSTELRLAISGEGSKLTKVSGLPYTTQTRSATSSFQQMKYINISVGGTTLTDITSCSIELENGIDWISNSTVHAGLEVTNAASSIYPSDFFLKDRTLSGSFSQYVTSDQHSFLQSWNVGTPIVIHAGPSATEGFNFDIPLASFTNRINTGTVYTQNYDWRMVSNTSNNLSTIITHT